MSKKQDAFYFDNFIACAEYSCRAAHRLREVLTDFRPDEISEKFDEIHEIERQADEERHELNDMLIKAFITPIEREDIAALSHDLDEVTDKIEDVLLRIYMNHVTRIEPAAVEMTDVIIRCCEAVKELLEEFSDFKRSKKLKEQIIRINELEEESDRLFMSSMRELHTQSADPLHIIAWREIYGYLEHCADACEHAADVVESVVMKNS